MVERAKTLALFCRVVDNYGDIGICWRLSQQLQREHGIAVTLWVDDLASFRRLCPEVSADAEIQQVAGVTVRHWRKEEHEFSPADVADIVIEFFAVDIPENYIAAMALCEPRPAWINFEGLSAEEWVEGCHTLPSSHPRMPLTKYFFFPGFTEKTGGLLREAGLEARRAAFQSSHEAADFLAQLGLTAQQTAATKVSMFCYPDAPLSDLFAAWQRGSETVVCLVPEGVATVQVQAFLGKEAKPGAAQTRGALTVRVLPFLPQADYDKLLWACDANFVRGEDSWVRAQWAGKPFIWHIYPQDENLHHVKLRAFLQRYAPDIGSLNALSLHWNSAATGSADWPDLWQKFQADAPKIAKKSEEWGEQVVKIGDLTSNLLKFCESVHSKGTQSTL